MSALRDEYDLEVAQVIDNEKLPEFDELYQGTAKEIEDAKSTDNPDGEDPASVPAPAAEGDADQTQPPQEGDASPPEEESDAPSSDELRKPDDLENATEGLLDNEIVRGAGRMIGSAAVDMTTFAFSVLKDLAILTKNLGVQYGPSVLRRIKTSVALVLNRAGKSLFKFTTSNIDAAKRKRISFDKSMVRCKRYADTVKLLKDSNATLTRTEPFSDERFWKLFHTPTQGKTSIKASIDSANRLLNFIAEEIEPAIEADIRVVEQLIAMIQHGSEINVTPYLKPPLTLKAMVRRDLPEFTAHRGLLDTYVQRDVYPGNIFLACGMPSEEILKQAIDAVDPSVVAKAYQVSFLALIPNPQTVKSIPYINYVDLDGLDKVLQYLLSLCQDAIKMTEGYKRNVTRAERLKRGMRAYLDWLVASEEQKSLKRAQADVIYLKQSFVTRVYQPAMLDIHDFVARYVSDVLDFIELNLKAFSTEEPADDSQQPSEQ